MKILIDKATVELALEALEFDTLTTVNEDTIKVKVKIALKEALAQPDHSCQTTGICALSSTFIELVNVGLPRGTVILRSDKLEAKL